MPRRILRRARWTAEREAAHRALLTLIRYPYSTAISGLGSRILQGNGCEKINVKYLTE